MQPKIYNLGTGTGISVLEIVAAFEKYTGKKVGLTILLQGLAFRHDTGIRYFTVAKIIDCGTYIYIERERVQGEESSTSPSTR